MRLACNRKDSRHRAAPSIASICDILSAMLAAEPMACSYCRKARCTNIEGRKSFSLAERRESHTYVNMQLLSVDIPHNPNATRIGRLVSRNQR